MKKIFCASLAFALATTVFFGLVSLVREDGYPSIWVAYKATANGLYINGNLVESKCTVVGKGSAIECFAIGNKVKG